MSVPSVRRRGLRRARRIASILAALLFAGAAVAVARVFRAGASPLPAAGAVYGAAVAWGVGEMARLRERVLFHPSAPPAPHSPLLWWGPRLLLVVVVASLPAVLLLGGLTRR